MITDMTTTRRPAYEAVKLRMKEDLDALLSSSTPAEEVAYRIRQRTKLVVSTSSVRRWRAEVVDGDGQGG